MFSAFTVLSPDGWMVKLRDNRRAYRTRDAGAPSHHSGQPDNAVAPVWPTASCCGHYWRHAVRPCSACLQGCRAREDFPSGATAWCPRSRNGLSCSGSGPCCPERVQFGTRRLVPYRLSSSWWLALRQCGQLTSWPTAEAAFPRGFLSLDPKPSHQEGEAMSATTSDTTTEVLASPFTINKLLIKNRIVLGPTAVLRPTENGRPSGQTIAFLARRAKGRRGAGHHRRLGGE